jgi:hypothetical protein
MAIFTPILYCLEIFRLLYSYSYGVPITILAPYSVRLYAIYSTVLSPNLQGQEPQQQHRV